MKLAELQLGSIVRTLAVAAVVLPISLSYAASLNAPLTDEEKLIDKLTIPCISWAFSEKNSSVEETAEERIDDEFGGKVNRKNVCEWVLD